MHTKTKITFGAVALLATALAACGGGEGEQEDTPPVVILNNASEDNSAANNQVSNNQSTGNSNANNQSMGNGAPNTQTGPLDDCPVEARPIYVIDGRDYTLSSFDPRSMTFEDVGQINCPAADPRATPFSMSIDRDALAWVLYTTGELFLVDTTTAECQPTLFRPNNGFTLFGMGYVLDKPGATEDVLYIAGSDVGPGQGASNLGRVDFETRSYQQLGGLSGDPELTGTAAGELWGFFPDTTPPKVAQIDRETGVLGKEYPITGITGDPNAWAFAFWGGDFYLFYKSQQDESTRIFKLEGDDGAVTEVDSNTGRYIVGAGVSTCAPLVSM